MDRQQFTLISGSPTAYGLAPRGVGGVQPQGCPIESWYQARAVGTPSYEAIGPSQGKYNGSPAASTMSYQVTTTTSKSSTMSVGASISAGWAIATVEATLGYDVTTSTSQGVSLTDTLVVPAYRYGYQQPKIERRSFAIDLHRIGSTCVETVSLAGYLYGIAAYPFWSSCRNADGDRPSWVYRGPTERRFHHSDKRAYNKPEPRRLG